MRGGAGRARFTGKSASLKAVSGRSTPGTVQQQTAAASRKRTNIQRSRPTLPHSECQQLTTATTRCQCSLCAATVPQTRQRRPFISSIKGLVLLDIPVRSPVRRDVYRLRKISKIKLKNCTTVTPIAT